MTDLEPFKIVGQLIGVAKNEDGEVVGEQIMGEVAIYRANFGKLEEIVDEAVADAKGG